MQLASGLVSLEKVTKQWEVRGRRWGRVGTLRIESLKSVASCYPRPCYSRIRAYTLRWDLRSVRSLHPPAGVARKESHTHGCNATRVRRTGVLLLLLLLLLLLPTYICTSYIYKYIPVTQNATLFYGSLTVDLLESVVETADVSGPRREEKRTPVCVAYVRKTNTQIIRREGHRTEEALMGGRVRLVHMRCAYCSGERLIEC